jgi:CobQ-like glutamine amidotransferase family enzyme
MADESRVHVGLILPDVLGTYGDSGNATVLRKRLEWRGIPARVHPIRLGEPVPASFDLYLLGGGEDTAQALASEHLRRHQGMRRAVRDGAVVFGVCAGLQILGARFTGLDGVSHDGLGMLDLVTVPGRRRSVSEVVSAPDPRLGADAITGFENHLGLSTLGPGSVPLGRVLKGTGNGDGTEGGVAGRVAATYLHGPVLARNPALADLLLGWAVGAPLPELPVAEIAQLREERLRAAHVRPRRAS